MKLDTDLVTSIRTDNTSGMHVSALEPDPMPRIRGTSHWVQAKGPSRIAHP